MQPVIKTLKCRSQTRGITPRNFMQQAIALKVWWRHGTGKNFTDSSWGILIASCRRKFKVLKSLRSYGLLFNPLSNFHFIGLPKAQFFNAQSESYYNFVQRNSISHNCRAIFSFQSRVTPRMPILDFWRLWGKKLTRYTLFLAMGHFSEIFQIILWRTARSNVQVGHNHSLRIVGPSKFCQIYGTF